MATIFERIINVVDHFDTYSHIDKVANLSSRVKTIKNDLSVMARKDFEESFSNPFTKVSLIFLFLSLIVSLFLLIN